MSEYESQTAFEFIYFRRTFKHMNKIIFIFCRKIIWLGDLNYRLNVPYEKAWELLSRSEWSKLVEKDQVRH